MNVNETFQYLNVDLPEDIRRRKCYGDFTGALRLIDRKLAQDIPDALRNCLTAQREMMARLPEDFPYTREEALALVQAEIPDFTEAEFDELVDAGQIRWIYVDGEPRYFNRFLASICKSIPALAKRSIHAGNGSGESELLDRCIQVMRDRGQIQARIRIRASLRLKDKNFTPGMFLRAHLPLPIVSDTQSDIVIEKVFPAHGRIAPGDALQRTVCWEETMEENHEFYVEYSYTRTSVCHDPRQMTAAPEQPDCCTEEQEPHIVFSPMIRMLARELAAGVTDPLEKARRYYDYITLHMNYTYMPEYFALEHIAEECARSMTGDCGVFALLFITLCRCVGIPAQWESGLTAEPDCIGSHDWARFHIAPYGWLYADPSYGIAARRQGNEERRKFYFGNLDPYRMAANRAFQAPFTVPKSHWRADPYDNQSGEMETAERCFCYDEYERDQKILLCKVF